MKIGALHPNERGSDRWVPSCSRSLRIKGLSVSDFEESLLALDARLEELQKLGKAVVSAIGRARAAVKVGRATEITKGLGAISQRIAEANGAAHGLASGWSFDTSTYLADGRFLDDLKAAAAEKGL